MKSLDGARLVLLLALLLEEEEPLGLELESGLERGAALVDPRASDSLDSVL